MVVVVVVFVFVNAYADRLIESCVCACAFLDVCVNEFRPFVLRDTYIAHHLIIHGMARRGVAHTYTKTLHKSLTHKDFVSFYMIFFSNFFFIFICTNSHTGDFSRFASFAAFTS